MAVVPDPLVMKATGSPKTVGISPKAVWAAISSAVAAFITTVISAGVSGNFNKTEFIIAAVGAASSALSALGAFLAKPGLVIGS